MSKINVVLATDANYLRYVEVTLKSLLAHNQNLSVFIMYTGDVSPEWGDRLKPYFEKRNSTLKLVYFDENHLASFNPSTYISTTTYLRFYIPSLFQYSESPYWIYLDCDIVINGDVTRPFYLYNFEISANSKLYQPGACLENHSRNLHSLLCGIFRHGILRNCHNRFSNFSPYKSPADRKSHVLDTSLRTFHSSGRQTLLSLHSYL